MPQALERAEGCWAWVVLLAAVVTQGLTLGFPTCIGIFFTELQREFQANNSETSWFPSILTAMLHAGGKQPEEGPRWPLRPSLGGHKLCLSGEFLRFHWISAGPACSQAWNPTPWAGILLGGAGRGWAGKRLGRHLRCEASPLSGHCRLDPD